MTKLSIRRPFFIAMCLLLPACLAAEERPAQWSYLHAAIVVPSCATSGCHSSLTIEAGVDLSDPDAASNRGPTLAAALAGC